jgi:hypothetical protein
MNGSNTRVVSFLNDTADQQEKLEELISESKAEKQKEALVSQSDKTGEMAVIKENAKQDLSKWGLLHFKLQVLLLGKIVLSDSHLWNNFFLHGLSDGEYDEFVDFVSSKKVIEARCRPHNIPSVFEKTPNIRNYWSDELNAAVEKYNTGRVSVLGNKRILTAQEYINTLENESNFTDFKAANDFDEYKRKILRCDSLYRSLGAPDAIITAEIAEKSELIKLWNPMVNDDLFMLLKKPPNGESIFVRIKALKELDGANLEGVDALWEYVDKQTTYNGSELEKLCLRTNVDADRGRNFHLNQFHKEVFCRGLAKQHECGFMQLRNDEYIPDKNELKLFITTEGRKNLCKMTWKELSDHFERNTKFVDIQKELVSTLKDTKVKSLIKENLFKELLRLLKVESEHDRDKESKQNDPVVTSTSISADSTKLYVTDAQKATHGEITIKIG